jgi:hypothetical protein
MAELIIDYTLSADNLHIEKSYEIRPRKVMNEQLDLVRAENDPYIPVLQQRTNKSMIREWRAHNLLWDLHLFRSHTCDVDLNIPQPWYISVLYFILSIFYFG